jgi:hypothetical protein
MLNYKTIKFLDSQNRELIISDFESTLTRYNTTEEGINLKAPTPKLNVVKIPGSDFAQVANINYAGRFVRINGRFVDYSGSAESTRDSITYLKSFERQAVSAEVYFGSDNSTNSKKTYTIDGTITEVSTLKHDNSNEYNFLVSLFSPTPYFCGETITNTLFLGKGGRGYSKNYNFGYKPSGSLSISNEGDTTGFANIRIKGPAQNIVVNGNNASFVLGTIASPFTIQNDEFVDIDSQNQIVTNSNGVNLTALTNNIFDPFRIKPKSTLNLQILANLTDKTTSIITTLQTPFIQID